MMNIDLNEMGLRLKKYRLYKNLTQQKLADLMGVSLARYKSFENGERSIDTGFDAIEESIDYILSGVHSIDIMVDKALMTMPEYAFESNKKQLDEFASKLLGNSVDINESMLKYKDVLNEFDEYYHMLVKYSEQHMFTKPARDYVGPHFYTLITDAKYAGLNY